MRISRVRMGARGTGQGAGGRPDATAPRPSPLAPVILGFSLLVGVAARAETVNRIVAIVNDDIITEADVASHVSALLEDQGAEAPPMPSDQMREAVLQRLIEQRLILQEAQRANVSVSAQEVIDRLEELRARFGSEEMFRQSLTESHLTEPELKEKLREQLLVQRVIDDKVRSTIVVSPQEVARELSAHPELAKPGDRVRASHILVRVDERRSVEAARQLIAALHQQLLHGADFAELAKQHSEDSHRDEGGMMGWVAQGELLPELDTVLFSLKEGAVSEPIQTQLGFHLVRVEERRTATSLSVTEANHAIFQRLYQRKFQAALVKWLADLKRHAYLELLPASPDAPHASAAGG